MPQEWTASVVAQMHLAKITKKQLAEEAGYTPEYVSMGLNGHRDTETGRLRPKGYPRERGSCTLVRRRFGGKAGP